MAKRIFLLVITNLLVMVTISIVWTVLSAVFGIGRYTAANGIDLQSLMLFSLVWGFGGAFISLFMSKMMAKWMMGVQIIDPNTRDPQAQALLRVVHKLAQGAQLPAMPEVRHLSKSGAQRLCDRSEQEPCPCRRLDRPAPADGVRGIEGVLGHEITHVANGDMVTMTLIQGVINAFIIFFARLAAYAVANLMRGDNDRGPSYMVQYLLVNVFHIAFAILGSIVVCWFSRRASSAPMPAARVWPVART